MKLTNFLLICLTFVIFMGAMSQVMAQTEEEQGMDAFSSTSFLSTDELEDQLEADRISSEV